MSEDTDSGKKLTVAESDSGGNNKGTWYAKSEKLY